MARKNEKVFLEAFFDRIPSLPKGLLFFLVTITPFVIAIGLAFVVLSFLRLFLSFFQSGTQGMGAFFQFTGIAGILLLIQIIFYLYIAYLGYKALPHLFGKKLSGWRIMYKVQIYSTIFNLVMFFVSTGLFSPFFAIIPGMLMNTLITGLVVQCIGIFIGFYFLFKMKPFYKK